MAAVNASVLLYVPSTTPVTFFGRSDILGTAVQGLPALVSTRAHISTLKIEAKSRGKAKAKPLPYGPAGGAKFRDGVDASGRKAKGKGVYQFTNKYGANVDGYSPIYSPDEWSITGDTYSGGPGGLTLWVLTLGAVLLGGALLVYNTSALSQ